MLFLRCYKIASIEIEINLLRAGFSNIGEKKKMGEDPRPRFFGKRGEPAGEAA